MKVVVNTRMGGYFSLSPLGFYAYAEKKGIQLVIVERPRAAPKCYPKEFYSTDQREKHRFYPGMIPRADPCLVETVEKLGSKANGFLATLEVLDVPESEHLRILACSGAEYVANVTDTWGPAPQDNVAIV